MAGRNVNKCKQKADFFQQFVYIKIVACKSLEEEICQNFVIHSQGVFKATIEGQAHHN